MKQVKKVVTIVYVLVLITVAIPVLAMIAGLVGVFALFFGVFADLFICVLLALLQYMPDTWNYHGCGNIWDVSDQLKCGLQDIRAGRIKQWVTM